MVGLPTWEGYVGLGGNLGDVPQAFARAIRALSQTPGVRVDGVSSLYQSRPVDATGPDYLNAVVAVTASLGAHELLSVLQALEQQADRTRPFHHAPRTLDADLLCYGGLTCHTPRLCLPHPRASQRAFVLAPLQELMATLGREPARALADLPWPGADAIEAMKNAQGIFCLGALEY